MTNYILGQRLKKNIRFNNMRNIFFLPLFLFFANVLQAKQIEVCSTCEIKTLKEAISIADDGDEIADPGP